MENEKCTCHERDSSYTCASCKKQGLYGHMEHPSEVKICYVYYDYEDFTSSCDPIRVDLVVDGNSVDSKSTHKYGEYRDAVQEFVETCELYYDGVEVQHVCVKDGCENYN